jgi:pimeloyl-ACP methyl ester carboxylesterase/DNA-binding CsgD family transcriptional regulator
LRGHATILFQQRPCHLQWACNFFPPHARQYKIVTTKKASEIRFATSADGTRIAYTCEGAGPVLVRAGLWMGHLEQDWKSPVRRPLLEEMCRTYSYCRYDARGCGLSDRDVTDVSLEAMVGDLEAVVDAAGLDQFPLLGLSAGGALSIAYAAKNPRRVSRMVLYGPYARGPLKRNPTPKQIEEAQLLVKMIELGWDRENPAYRQVHTSQFMPGATKEQMDDWNELQRLTLSPEMAVRHKLSREQWDVSGLLPQIKCPVLVIHCRDDARVPPAEGRLLASQIPNARLVTLEGKNHVLMKGDPAFDEFLVALRDFVPPGKRQADTSFAELSRREREVLELVAQGLDNLQISAHLGVAEKTVRNVMTNIFDKIAVENRPQAIVRAREAGFGATHH